MAPRLLMIGLVLVMGSLAWLFWKENSGDKGVTQPSDLSLEVARTPFRVPLQKEETPLELPADGLAIESFTGAFGGVVPHHLVASSLLTEFFTLLKNREPVPATILLLAPNHGELGERNIQTADFLWQTALGEIATDPKLLRVVEKAGAQLVPQSFENEHSIYNILPYIAHFLPGTRLVPIIFKYQTTSSEIETFSQAVAREVAQGNIFIVSSVDFSHYLSQGEADRKDEETLMAIKNFDTSRIAQFGSEHLDSPASILTLLRLGQILDTTGITVLRHSNSAESIRSRNTSTTSHFTFFLHPKP